MRETVDNRAVYKLGYMLETPEVSCATRSFEGRDPLGSVRTRTLRTVKMRQVRSISRKDWH